VAGGTPQVDQTAIGEEDYVTTVRHKEAIDLRLNVLHTLGVFLQPSNINLDVEVTNI
jgi:hypothetical protein